MMRRIPQMVQRMGVIATVFGTLVIGSAWLSDSALAASAKEIDTGADEAIVKFDNEIKGGKAFLTSSKGILVFPTVIKGGAGFGGEYGEGALRIAGKTADYYSMLQGSFGLQLGGEVKTVYLVFLEQEALDKFRAGEGWKAGVDGSVSLVTLGAGGTIDTNTLKDPIVAFILGQKGLMYNLSLEGTKFTKQKKA